MKFYTLAEIERENDLTIFDGGVIATPHGTNGDFNAKRSCEVIRGIFKRVVVGEKFWTTRNVALEIGHIYNGYRNITTCAPLLISREVEDRFEKSADFSDMERRLRTLGRVCGLYDHGLSNGDIDCEIATWVFDLASGDRRVAFLSGDKKLVDMVGGVAGEERDGKLYSPIGVVSPYYFDRTCGRFFKYHDVENNFLEFKSKGIEVEWRY